MIRRSELSALSWEIVWFYEFVMLLPYPALRSQALGITSLCRCGLCCKCSLLLPLFSVIICVLFFFFFYIYCVHVHIYTDHNLHAEDRGQLPGVGSLIPSCESWVLMVCQAWWQSPLPSLGN